jgi:mannose-6-phosphate isomerase-like protein (cupin superfamily)
MALETGMKAYRLKAEDIVIIPVSTPHRITNVSEDKALRFVSINSPG